MNVYNKFSRDILKDFAKSNENRIIFFLKDGFDADMCYIKCVEWAKYLGNSFNVQVDGYRVICYKSEG